MESKLTTRSQEAIAAAQRLAVDRGQAALEPLHLLVALLEQTDGIAGPLLQAVGADPADVRAKAEAAAAPAAQRQRRHRARARRRRGSCSA